jgi:hypothetical protein
MEGTVADLKIWMRLNAPDPAFTTAGPVSLIRVT